MMEDPRTDEELVEAVKAGDSTALSLLFYRLRPTVINALYKRLRSHQDAEEVFQLVMIRVHERIDRFNERFSDNTLFLPWVMRIANNLAIDFMRARDARRRTTVRESDLGGSSDDKSFYETFVADPNGTALDQDIHQEELSSLRWCLTQLSAEDQTVLRCRFYDGMRSAEAAKELGISHRLFDYRLKRAKENLKILFQNRFGVRI